MSLTNPRETSVWLSTSILLTARIYMCIRGAGGGKWSGYYTALNDKLYM